MDETQYHQLSNTTLERIADILEKADSEGALELEMEGGVITIALENGKHFVISKHSPTRQIWLSSPISGGLHFGYDMAAKDWRLPDGRELLALLGQELAL